MILKRPAANAFTLIELLIVVAIIAILAAIAVPNFLEAQTRAKVSRARADSRTLIVALEAYAVDYNMMPAGKVLQPVVSGTFGNVTAESFPPTVLSTPVAYISNVLLEDPFVRTGAVVNISANPAYSTLFYQNVETSVDAALGNVRADYLTQTTLSASQITGIKAGLAWGVPIYKEAYGRYKLGSIGPDQDYNGGANKYDPTNGTVSAGDLYRTEKRPEGGGV